MDDLDAPDFTAAAIPAARWWADQIRDIKAETDGIHPDLTAEQAFVTLAGVSLRAQQIDSVPAPDDTALAAFTRELVQVIAATKDRRLNLFVDYGPDPVLRQAAVEAEVSTALFPNKTRMQVWPEASDDPTGPECARQRWHDGRHDWQRS